MKKFSNTELKKALFIKKKCEEHKKFIKTQSVK